MVSIFIDTSHGDLYIGIVNDLKKCMYQSQNVHWANILHTIWKINKNIIVPTLKI